MTHKINLLATIIRSQWTTGFGLGGLWLISQCFPNMEAWKLNFFLFFFFVLMWFVICCWLTPSCEQIMTWRCIPLPWRQVAYIVCLSSANTNSSRFTLSQTLNEASPVSLLRFPKTTNDSQLAEMIIGEMVRGSAWTFSSSMVHVYVTVGCNHKSRCVFPLCAHVWSTVTYFDMQIRRAASVTLSANFSQGTVTSSSTHSSTKAVFCLCGELLFS